MEYPCPLGALWLTGLSLTRQLIAEMEANAPAGRENGDAAAGDEEEEGAPTAAMFWPRPLPGSSHWRLGLRLQLSWSKP